MTNNEYFPIGCTVTTNFLTDKRSVNRIGTVVAEPSSTLNSKLRGCVMVLWKGDTIATPVHPSNLDKI